MACLLLVNQRFDGNLNYILPFALAIKSVSNDIFTLNEMLKQDNVPNFVKVMQVEVEDHESWRHWTLMNRSEIPAGSKIILAIWSIKRNHSPDGRLVKHKDRLCAHGGMQRWGIDRWEI